jgi:sugar phosphate isomerase/epimerase
MKLGIMARTFIRPTLDDCLDEVVAAGLPWTQFNLSCAGLPNMPDALDAADVTAIRESLAARSITMSSLSGTYNMIHPDLTAREEGLRQLGVLIAWAHRLGTGLVTLCTGTRDPENMWRRHPGNDAPEAYRDLLQALQRALPLAEAQRVVLGVEPEPANVVDRPSVARRLLDDLRSPWLKIVMDGANLFHPGEIERMSQVLDEAFALLGPDIALAHAKDLVDAGHFVAPGRGRLDYGRYLSLLRAAGYDGALIMHSLEEHEVSASTAFLRTGLGRLTGFGPTR